MCLEDFSGIYSYLSYNTFDERLLSFEKWNGVLPPVELALAGFYYTGESDIVRCFWCKVDIHRWKAGDMAIKDHLKYSKNCTYAKLIREKLDLNIMKECHLVPTTYLGAMATSSNEPTSTTYSKKTNRVLYTLLVLNIISNIYSTLYSYL